MTFYYRILITILAFISPAFTDLPFKITKNVTKTCSRYCTECEAGFCKVCELGYFVNKLSGKCIVCNNWCAQCTGLDECLLCSDGYIDKKINEDDGFKECALDYTSKKLVLLASLVFLTFLLLSFIICKCLKTGKKVKNFSGKNGKIEDPTVYSTISDDSISSISSNITQQEIKDPSDIYKIEKNSFTKEQNISVSKISQNTPKLKDLAPIDNTNRVQDQPVLNNRPENYIFKSKIRTPGLIQSTRNTRVATRYTDMDEFFDVEGGNEEDPFAMYGDLGLGVVDTNICNSEEKIGLKKDDVNQ